VSITLTGLLLPGDGRYLAEEGGRLKLSNGSFIRIWFVRQHHVWIYDLVHVRTQDGKVSWLLMVVGKFSWARLGSRHPPVKKISR